MDHHHLRAILLKLQDRLSDDDRRRLHFFLGNDVPRRIRDDPSLSGTLRLIESLFDQDKINEQDFSFLINAFDEIQCLDAANFLREHMRRIQSNEINQSVQSLSLLMPSLVEQVLKDQDDKYSVRTNLINPTNISVNDKNIKNDSMNVSVNIQKRSSLSLEQNKLLKRSSMTKTYLVLFILLTIILATVVLGGYIWIMQFRNKYDDIVKQIKYNETVIQSNNDILAKKEQIEYLKKLQATNNETILHLNNLLSAHEKTIGDMNQEVERLEEEQKIGIGTTCSSCKQWCREEGSPYGECGNGYTCICGQYPIPKETVDKQGSCDSWCHKYGYKNGGSCGDGYSCICLT